MSQSFKIKLNVLVHIIKDQTDISYKDMASESRFKEIMLARVILANILMKELTQLEVGGIIKRGNSTICYYKMNHRNWYETDKSYRELFNQIKDEYDKLTTPFQIN